MGSCIILITHKLIISIDMRNAVIPSKLLKYSKATF
jgi:hypothetical protein